MDSSLKLTLLFSLSLLSFTPPVTATGNTPPPSLPPSPQPQQQPPLPSDDHSSNLFSHASLLPPILSHLGFQDLSSAAPSLSSSAWSGPSTVFAPSDLSLRSSCPSCSLPDLLRQHILPGYFPFHYLRNLPFGSKIETLSPGRCLTITSNNNNNLLSSTTTTNNTTTTTDAAAAKVFINGMQITQPELFNNGIVLIHGIQGFVSPLSPFSCDVQTISSNSDHRRDSPADSSGQPNLMRLMIKDAMLRLRNNGFNILALAMKVKYSDLVSLSNMTIFAVDDLSIFSGSSSYISNVRFHIVPDRYLTVKELEDLHIGTSLPTLEKGQNLIVTTAAKNGRGHVLSSAAAPMRINYVRMKVPEVVRNMRIVVHSLYLPFPHVSPFAAAYDSLIGGGDHHDDHDHDGHGHDEHMMMGEGMCDAGSGKNGHCGGEAPSPQAKPMVEIEEHHGV